MGVWILKIIFIIFTGLFSISKIEMGIYNNFKNDKERLINLMEIVIGIILTFVIYNF